MNAELPPFKNGEHISESTSTINSDQHTLIKDKLIGSKPAPWITPEPLYYRRDWTKQKAVQTIEPQRDYL